ncbi:MAG TPA: 2,3-bisphosphoglycerate-independent phosphoglycerate mutase [Candidatus Paceibacterota bacterium]|nr:2,3-bisphosphoglycerate-independent phosphoglycerate mutase [Candidatus Paceibacterota bacterium]
MENTKKQVALIVLDGWGYREDGTHNAVAQAKTPNFDKYWRDYPHALLEASGLAVGLPEGQMGNSEIGHTTIGAGKIIDTDLVRIKKAIDVGEYDRNPAFQALFEHVKFNSSTLHVQGLLGEGGVHAHSDHLFAFLKAAKKAGIERVAIHVFADGRDTPPQSAAEYLKELERVLGEVGIGFIATVSGRFYAMDRDNNWDRLAKVEQALFECKGAVCQLKDTKPSDYIASLYQEGKVDEHLEPIVCLDHEGKGCAIEDNDAVFFFNFRPDRARMLSQKILEQAEGKNLCFVTMTEYHPEFKCLVAFPPISIETTLAAEISKAGLTQAHIAETEKFPHATYFLNGGKNEPHDGETHIMLESRKDVPTHDLAPKMRAEGIADKAIEQIEAGTNFIFINFANPDMVGHTANVPAIIEAVEEVDMQLGRVIEALSAQGGVAFITADHGNAEVNVDPQTGEKHTAHTVNPVPAILTSQERELADGTLADLAPTVLALLDVPQPASMTGKSLLSSSQNK